jgi:adenylosuccinate lyase
MKEGLQLLRNKMVVLVNTMKGFAEKYASTPTLGYTHCQPAQLTTIGKRCVMWLQDFIFDFHELSRLIDTLPMRGVKGTTGTQATFLELFNGDHAKVLELDRKVCTSMGFGRSIAVTGQTYSRKLDFFVLSALSGLAQSAYKMCSDIRLLASMKEIGTYCLNLVIFSKWRPSQRSRLRKRRLARVQWRTNATPCVQSGSVRWLGSSSLCQR